jgi:perosamine synthetase
MSGIKKMKIPVYKPSIGRLEKYYVNECLDSSWISSKGKYVKLFEDQFAKKINVNYSTTVCNGTVALHLALLALGISEGDEVIVPTFTYIASVNSIQYTGAKPVFVDCDPISWQISPKDILKKITPKTKAIMVVHLYGQSCDMESICKIAHDKNIFVIEDCAEAFGTKFHDQYVGSFGDIATYSFFGNKTITTGEGGIVVTNNETLYNRAKHLKGQGLAEHRQYWHDTIGYNYRLTNIACAIGCAQLERCDEIIKRKREIADFYKKSFEGSDYEFHQEMPNTYHSYWMCSILISRERCFRETRDNLMKHLEQKGIETRPLFYPVHTMPMHYSKYQMHRVCEDISRRGINLPSFPDLTQEELDYIVESVLNYAL